MLNCGCLFSLLNGEIFIKKNKLKYLDAENSSLKIRDLHINIKSKFDSKNNLSDLLFSIANLKLKEKILTT